LDEDAHRLTKAYKFSTGGKHFQGSSSPYALHNMKSFCNVFLQVFATFTTYLKSGA